MNSNDRLKIQNSVHDSQVFRDYKRVADSEKADYYFSYNLASIRGYDKIDQDSLFSHSVNALKIKQKESGLNDIKYDLHILLVGTSLQPLMLSVSAINAISILLLYSLDGTEEKKDDLKDYIKRYKGIDADSESIKSSEPYTVFSCIKNTMEKEEWKNKKICIHITGGKKSMVGGGFLAASILGIDSYYIDFEKYDRGVPVICTEFLNKLDNPYDIYNINEESLIKSLLERQDFEAVAVVADEAIEKLTEEKAKKYDLEKERNRLTQIKKAARCYSDWSRFNYSDAVNSVFDYYEREQKGLLSKLRDCKNLRKDAYGAILLSLDRWTRGVDALGLCDLDKSALCFTQAIEVLCEYRLYDMAENGFVSPQFDIGTIHFDVSSLIKFLWNSEKQNMVINQLESRQNVTYVWNKMMRFDKKIKPSSGKLIEKLSIRNKLAHFNCYDKEKDAKNMAKVKELKDTVRLLIECFILIYQNEEKLKEKTFDVLQAPFNFAKYSDFD